MITYRADFFTNKLLERKEISPVSRGSRSEFCVESTDFSTKPNKSIRGVLRVGNHSQKILISTVVTTSPHFLMHFWKGLTEGFHPIKCLFQSDKYS